MDHQDEPAQPHTNGNSTSTTEQTQAQANGNQTISEDEIALYDRQIRLWGVQAQERLRNANILLITIRSLSNEIAKNLVLAGINSLTIQDDQAVTGEDLGAQFLISEEDIGKNRAEAAAPRIRKLNPRVAVKVDTQPILTRDVDYYLPFDMVIATDLDLRTFSTINAACRLSGKPFYASATNGLYGFIFADLNEHYYQIERAQSNRPTALGPETPTRNVMATANKTQDGKTIEVVTKREIYVPIVLANTSPLPAEILGNRRRKAQVPPLLSCLRALWEFQTLADKDAPAASRYDLELFTSISKVKHQELQLPLDTLQNGILKSFLHNVGSELTPVTAFLGGKLAEDVINVLGQREQPIQNFLIFDGEDNKAPVYALHPIFPEMDMSVPVTVPSAPAPGLMSTET